MCRYTIVWIDDHVKGETWIFDGVRELWSKIYIVQKNESVAPTLASTSTVLSLSVSITMLGKSCTCHCNEAIIAFNLTGRVDTARVMWRHSSQGCFNARSGGYFERLDFGIQPDPNTDVGYPVDIAGNTAVSITSEGLIFVIAPSTGLWQYDGKRNCWSFRANSSIINVDSVGLESYSACCLFPKETSVCAILRHDEHCMCLCLTCKLENGLLL